MRNTIVAAAFAGLFALSTPASAGPTTLNDITVDVPGTYKTMNSNKGMKLQSGDGAVDVWFERYPSDGVDQLVADNKTYWKKQNVELPTEPVKTEGKLDNGRDFTQLDFPNATWKGDPTVVRYVFFQPSDDAKADLIVITIWGTPAGDDAHQAEIIHMCSTAKAG